MVFRQNAPVLGAPGGPYLQKGEWQFTLGYRGLNSQRHYQGTRPHPEITSGVVNSQHIFTFQIARQLTDQLELNLDVPAVWNGFSLLRRVPGGGPDDLKRQAVRARGLSDLAVQARYWLLPCPEHPEGNVAVELGVKFPTGRYAAKDDVFDQVVPVDQSIQPGDSGLGFSLGAQAFKTVKDVTVFGSGTYLFNPKNLSGTPTFFGSLRGDTSLINSVPDQFLGRVGFGAPIRQVKGLSGIAAARVEGIPIRDLLGQSEGFRRPGYVLYFEPGFVYNRGKHTFALSMPIRMHQNVKDNPNTTTRIEDSTIPDLVVLFSYSRRFGGRG